MKKEPSNNMVYAFTVFKPESMDKGIRIVYPRNAIFDFNFKISKYVWLGYAVYTEIN